MNKFDPKHTEEQYNYSCSFAAHLTGDLTLTDKAVTVEPYKHSKIKNASTADMLVNSAAFNDETVTIKGEEVEPGQAIIQAIKGGVTGAVYVVTYKATRSDGEVIVEQVLLEIAEYVPSGCS